MTAGIPDAAVDHSCHLRTTKGYYTTTARTERTSPDLVPLVGPEDHRAADTCLRQEGSSASMAVVDAVLVGRRRSLGDSYGAVGYTSCARSLLRRGKRRRASSRGGRLVSYPDDSALKTIQMTKKTDKGGFQAGAVA